MKSLALKTALRACCTSINQTSNNRPIGNNMKSSTLVAVSVVVLVLLVGCADGALRVENARNDGNITLINLPGCCTYCTGPICPKICELCRPVVIEEGETVALELRVGPYPLERLEVQLKNGEIYCVGESDRSHLTETALLQVGPGSNCDREKPSVNARIVVEDECRKPPDSGRFEICLLQCDPDVLIGPPSEMLPQPGLE